MTRTYRASRYHRFRQRDGRGFGILMIDEDDVMRATVLHANMTDDEAAKLLAELRAGERRSAGAVS